MGKLPLRKNVHKVDRILRGKERRKIMETLTLYINFVHYQIKQFKRKNRRVLLPLRRPLPSEEPNLFCTIANKVSRRLTPCLSLTHWVLVCWIIHRHNPKLGCLKRLLR